MNNRIQLLIVLKYIMEKSAESEPVSNADILSYLASKNIKPCKMTLIEDLKVIKKAGYDLITIKKGKNNYYYIPSEHFDTTEARLITDSLISAKFVTPSTTERLLSKVMRLTDKEMEQHFINDIVLDFRLKHRNCNTTYSINVIQEALSREKRLNFIYFDLDENKNRVYRHNSKVYEVCPITMINGMDNYYLIAYDPHSGCCREKTFRIDRMAETVVNKKNIGEIPFDRDECIQRYRSSVFSMCRWSIRDKFLANSGLLRISAGKFKELSSDICKKSGTPEGVPIISPSIEITGHLLVPSTLIFIPVLAFLL